MAVASYEELITKTFRDNAIRSVMMIDDDFVPYSELCNPAFFATTPSEETINGLKKAAKIHHFFQEMKLVCDVDNNVDNVKIEKIRKCDLIILDYHLEHNNPEKSIGAIDELCDTDHMNLVVIYTREELRQVWLEVAASLFGSEEPGSAFAEHQAAQDFWDDATEYSGKIPSEWIELVTESDVASYIVNRKATKQTSDYFGDQFRKNGKPILNEICERKIKNYNHIKTKRRDRQIFGSFESERKWLQAGNIFIVLHSKSSDDHPNEAGEIWKAIETCLIDWKPPYYRLIISEMQNQLENEPIPFKKNLGQDLEGQAAWLHAILSKANQLDMQEEIRKLFERLVDELNRNLIRNNKLQLMVSETFNALQRECLDGMIEPLDFSATHMRLLENSKNNENLKFDIGHALNLTLCAREFDGDFITSGTVLIDKNNANNWYLCVSPACETVPVQLTGHLAKKLKPHRLIKVLLLEKTDIKTALAVADRSNHIFAKTAKNERKAFSVVNALSGQPSIDYALIKYHNKRKKSIHSDGIDVVFLHTNKDEEFTSHETVLVPVCQLREIYAARYQTLASQYTGRVGVDFVNFE